MQLLALLIVFLNFAFTLALPQAHKDCFQFHPKGETSIPGEWNWADKYCYQPPWNLTMDIKGDCWCQFAFE
jgi:hypothetical protein